MRRLLHPFLIVFSGLVAATYVYVSARLTTTSPERLALGIPYLAVWAIPIIYWLGGREAKSRGDHVFQAVGYIAMGWLSFVLVLTLVRDVALVAIGAFGASMMPFTEESRAAVPILATICSILGTAIAYRGPKVKTVDVEIEGLPDELHGFRIVQISDLHIGATIGKHYVRRVVSAANALEPDLVALTGDIVDGKLASLRNAAAPLAELKPKSRVFFVTGNHEYYAGAREWIDHLRTLGVVPLLNTHTVVEKKGRAVLIAGVLDPAVAMTGSSDRPDAELALRTPVGGGKTMPPARCAAKILLAHNPKLAPLGELSGFDLVLSGHTHAGQFLPWNFVTKLVHGPHNAGLARRDRTWVYVSAGTGSWGPPVRLGTTPELTLIRLVSSRPRDRAP